MKRRLAALLLVAALPAQAALFDDEEARKRIEQLRTEVNARMDKLEAASRGQIDLANQIEALKAEVAKLRGQVEVLSNEVESTQKRQKDFYIDLDNRLRKLEPQAGAEGKPADVKPAVDPAAESRDYEAALNLFKAGKHKDALGAFLAFIKAYPASPSCLRRITGPAARITSSASTRRPSSSSSSWPPPGRTTPRRRTRCWARPTASRNPAMPRAREKRWKPSSKNIPPAPPPPSPSSACRPARHPRRSKRRGVPPPR
ncbi:hypothetical protein MASR1M97_24560 [Candidatus Desulfobacillus denitrificans]